MTSSNPKKPHNLLFVKKAWHLTPHMIRVTLTGAKVSNIAAGCEGAHCKIFLPEPNQSMSDFSQQLEDGPRPIVRTYTVRHIRPEVGEMDIDFVDHGDAGPASAWARQAKEGDFCGFGGPGSVKIKEFYADHYLVVSDMSALPVAVATLEAMPSNASGKAFLEITSPEDKQDMVAPDGIDIVWITNPNVHKGNAELTRMIHDMPWPDGTVQTCIAGESTMIKDLRKYLMVDRALPKKDAYISGYWKIGLVEDEHQAMKRTETA